MLRVMMEEEMRKTATLTLLLISLILSGCSDIDFLASESPNAGMWHGHSVSVWGKEESMESVYPDGFDIELFSGGRGKVSVNGDTEDAIWTLKDGHFTIKWGENKLFGMLEGEKIVLESEQGTNVIFYKEGASVPPLRQIYPLSQESPTEPETSVENPVEEGFVLRSRWTGVIYNKDISGDFPFPEVQEVTGYIGLDSQTQREFFEIYAADDGKVILSMFINIESCDVFRAEIGEDDAWIYRYLLTPEEESIFDGYLYENTFSFMYEYDDGDGSASIVIALSAEKSNP
jgi:hypothetical protein